MKFNRFARRMKPAAFAGVVIDSSTVLKQIFETNILWVSPVKEMFKITIEALTLLCFSWRNTSVAFLSVLFSFKSIPSDL